LRPPIEHPAAAARRLRRPPGLARHRHELQPQDQRRPGGNPPRQRLRTGGDGAL